MEAITAKQADGRICPVMSSAAGHVQCLGPRCMWWIYDRQASPSQGWRPFRGTLDVMNEQTRPAGVPASWAFVHDEEDGPGWLEPEAEWQQRQRGGCAQARG